MKTNNKQLFIRVLGATLLSLATLLLVEFALSTFKPIYTCTTLRQYQYDDELGHVPRPNIKLNILTDHLIERQTNDIGSRNIQNLNELQNYKNLVFCLGDSYTEGVGNLLDGTYPFFLDMLLNRRNLRYWNDYAVINLGLGGYGSLQSYLVIHRFEAIFERQPDYILYFICSNDFGDDIQFQLGTDHQYLIKETPHYPPFLVHLNEYLEHNQIFLRSKLFASNTLKKFFLTSKTEAISNTLEGRERINIHPEPIDNWDFVEKSLPGLKKMGNYARERDIPLIISYTSYESDQYNLLKSYAGAKGLLFADFREDLQRMQNQGPIRAVVNEHSGGHFRPWVNYLLAQHFAHAIQSTSP